MKRLLFIAFTILFFRAQAQQTVEPSPIKWYDIQTADSLYKVKPKPLLIDVYTDWCKWCHYMMKTTYANKSLASYINTYFYPVRFNAETSDTIRFQGKTWTKNGRTNQLARYLLDNHLAYPSTVFYDLHGKKYRIPGYLRIRDIEPILVYMVEDIGSQNIPLDEFRLAYMLAHKRNYKDELAKVDSSQMFDTTGTVQWHSFEEVYRLEQKEPRPILVFSYVPWCYSCDPMKTVVFRNKQVADYVNKHFYAISFNAASQDTIVLGGKQYVSLGKGQPHQLAMVLFNRQFRFPAMLFLDKNFNVITRAYGFYLPADAFEIIQYIGSDAYKSMSFRQYVQNAKKQ